MPIQRVWPEGVYVRRLPNLDGAVYTQPVVGKRGNVYIATPQLRPAAPTPVTPSPALNALTADALTPTAAPPTQPAPKPAPATAAVR